MKGHSEFFGNKRRELSGYCGALMNNCLQGLNENGLIKNGRDIKERIQCIVTPKNLTNPPYTDFCVTHSRQAIVIPDPKIKVAPII